MENEKFDRETIDKYLEILVKKYPRVDLHLLEYIVASFLLYDVEKQEKPKEENEEFVKANKVIEELIEQRKRVEKELSERGYDIKTINLWLEHIE